MSAYYYLVLTKPFLPEPLPPHNTALSVRQLQTGKNSLQTENTLDGRCQSDQ